MDSYLRRLADYAEAKYWDNPEEIYKKKWDIEDKRKRVKDVLLCNDIDEQTNQYSSLRPSSYWYKRTTQMT